MNQTTELLIIGGGIAAASTAYWLCRNAQVLLLEQGVMMVAEHG
jgi:glycine/D-amino acid oxidase-like deaminating enzyme